MERQIASARWYLSPSSTTSQNESHTWWKRAVGYNQPRKYYCCVLFSLSFLVPCANDETDREAIRFFFFKTVPTTTRVGTILHTVLGRAWYVIFYILLTSDFPQRKLASRHQFNIRNWSHRLQLHAIMKRNRHSRYLPSPHVHRQIDNRLTRRRD